MRVKMAKVAPELMDQLFKSRRAIESDLPEDARIVHIERVVEYGYIGWRVWFSSEQFDEVPENTLAPEFDITFTNA